jgi:protein involved in polysaccharide export with SLBB domain
VSFTRTVFHAQDLLRLRSLIFVGSLAVACPLTAQQLPSGIPSAAQAQQLLQNRPDLAAQLRQRLEESGLTPDQIRDRLQAAGYPDSLLDAYLAGSGGVGSDTTTPSPQILNAIAQLGLVDSSTVDSLLGTARLDSLLAFRSRRRSSDTVDTGALAYADSALLGRALLRLRAPPNPYTYDSTADTAFYADSMRAVRAKIRSLIADTSIPYAAKQRILRLLAPSDSSLRVFGLNLFRRGSSSFRANLAGPVSASYQIEPGDQLTLFLTGDVQQTIQLPVQREGFVVIKDVGQIYVANVTMSQLESILYARLPRVYSGVRRDAAARTHFSVSVTKLHTNQVFVTGDVAQPGSYEISSAGTALTALYVAGGPSPNGSLRHIEIHRGGRVVDSLDVYSYLLHGDASHDIQLQGGDIVFVPVHGSRVKVVGEVVRPGIYELGSEETLADALHDAGGFQATAVRHRVQITRVIQPDPRVSHGGARVVMDVPPEDFEPPTAGLGGDPPVPMMADDSVYVFKVDVSIKDRVTVSGDVWTPGDQGFSSGMRLSDALKLAGGVKPDAYLGDVLISRVRSDSTRIQLRASLRDSTGTPVNDVILEDHDDVKVFALREMRPHQFVAIAGAVKRGGRIAYHEGMTARDLVLIAGGTIEGADLHEVEIARVPENRAAGVTAVTMRVPLDSTVALQPYDNVLVFREPNWALPRTVVVTGEVKYPGRYTLTSKTERLSSVLARAGGTTKEADPNGITLIRSQNRIGRIGVDVRGVEKNAKDRENLVMQDGDSISIPSYSGIVRVTGEVNAPTGVAYVPGKDLIYYVNAAGGPGARADVGRSFVTQPSGKVEAIRHHGILPASVPVPEAGARVYVPEKELRLQQPDQTLAYLGTAVSLIATLATVIYLSRH